MTPLDKTMKMRAGMRFERTIKGVTHTLEVVRVGKDGPLFKDGQGREFKTFGATAKAATGWASANPWYFWRLPDANGTTPKTIRKDRKAAGVADTIQATAEPVVAVAPTVEGIADIVFPGLNEAVAEQAAQGVRRPRRTAGSKGRRGKASDTTAQ